MGNIPIIRQGGSSQTPSGTGPYATAVAIPILACVAIVMSIPTMILHSKNRNYSVTFIIFWFILLNIFGVVNAAIWNNDDTYSWWDGEGLCDVEVKLTLASYVGVPGALVCLFRSLAAVLDTSCSSLVPSRARRWRNRVVATLFCVVIPIIMMVTSFLVQTNRYAIYEISGCVSVFDQSWASIVLFYMWPAIICLIAIFYCCLVLFRLYRYRAQFGDILKSSGNSWTKSRFFRLFFLSLVILLAIISFQTYILYDNVIWLLPWWHAFTWSTVHGKDWNSILMISTHGTSLFDRWVPIIGCFIVFLFSGLGKDATKLYRSILSSIGFNRCFACLSHRRRSTAPPPLNSSSRDSQAKLISERKWPSMSRTYVNNNISPFDYRYHPDCEQGFSGLPPQTPVQRNSNNRLSLWKRAVWGYVKRPFLLWASKSPSRSRHCSNDTPLPTYNSAPALTSVSANAWAGRRDRINNGNSIDGLDSPSSPTIDGFIQVKQVISQKRESTIQDDSV